MFRYFTDSSLYYLSIMVKKHKQNRGCARHEKGYSKMRTNKLLLAIIVSLSFICCSDRQDKTYLEQNFKYIASHRLGFELLSQEDIEKDFSFPKEWGNMKCLIAPNSDNKFVVWGHLLKIREFQYAFLRTMEENDDDTRALFAYIENDEKGTAFMYAFLGRGSNDMIVALFTGASEEIYKKAADSIVAEYESSYRFEKIPLP